MLLAQLGLTHEDIRGTSFLLVPLMLCRVAAAVLFLILQGCADLHSTFVIKTARTKHSVHLHNIQVHIVQFFDDMQKEPDPVDAEFVNRLLSLRILLWSFDMAHFGPFQEIVSLFVLNMRLLRQIVNPTGVGGL